MTIIKDLRLKRGITQSELANLCGVHQTAVSQWEKGRTLPDKTALVKLSDIFGVSIDTLMKKNPVVKQNSIPVLGYVRAGVPIEETSKLMGHSDISVTAKYYINVNAERKRDAIEKILQYSFGE